MRQICLICTLLFFCCVTKSKKLDETKIFNEYLQRKFAKEIPESPHLFVITGDGCISCRVSAARFFIDMLKEDTSLKTRITIIAADRYEFPDEICNDSRILVDEEIRRFWFINYASVTIIEAEKRKITRIRWFDVQNLDSIGVYYNLIGHQ